MRVSITHRVLHAKHIGWAGLASASGKLWLAELGRSGVESGVEWSEKGKSEEEERRSGDAR